ncbi:unnamed protein product [Protopolystoma xenopodis]|uniref:Uncharacterized protein n=1 Tax=Protopolystoma xenopodis TaxID=117903 RepID=A0A448XH34_9PLAT|nr:unnamed protein product [Protopolystoma xenopodis]
MCCLCSDRNWHPCVRFINLRSPKCVEAQANLGPVVAEEMAGGANRCRSDVLEYRCQLSLMHEVIESGLSVAVSFAYVEVRW